MHDLIRGGPLDLGKVQRGKPACEEIFAQETFELHKWDSKVKDLGIPWKEGTTLLSLELGKDSDAVSAIFPSESTWPTKRIILSKLAKMGLASLITLVGGRQITVLQYVWRQTSLGCQDTKRLHVYFVPVGRDWDFRAKFLFQDDRVTSLRWCKPKGVAATVRAAVVREEGVNHGITASWVRLARTELMILQRLEFRLATYHWNSRKTANYCLLDIAAMTIHYLESINVTTHLDNTSSLWATELRRYMIIQR